MSEWILCKDKLPEKGVVVWVTIAGSDIIMPKEGETLAQCMNRQHMEIRYVKTGFLDDEGWTDSDGFPMIVHPIAWMEYNPPEPFRGGGVLYTADEVAELDAALGAVFGNVNKDFEAGEPFDE